MNEETELAWLKLTDKTNLVLTTLKVFQYQDRGIFGENQTVIPRKAITTVRISWQRSLGLVLLGTILLLTYLGLMIGASIAGPANLPFAEIFSSAAAAIVQYGSLLGAIALFFGFWFYKRNEIEIMAPNTTIGGTPRSYEEAQNFCSLLVADLSEAPSAGKRGEEKTPTTPDADPADWQL